MNLLETLRGEKSEQKMASKAQTASKAYGQHRGSNLMAKTRIRTKMEQVLAKGTRTKKGRNEKTTRKAEPGPLWELQGKIQKHFYWSTKPPT